MSTPRWTITALTIPGREHYLQQLIQSLEATVIPGGARLVIVYNRAIRDELADVERTIRSWARHPRGRGALQQRRPHDQRRPQLPAEPGEDARWSASWTTTSRCTVMPSSPSRRRCSGCRRACSASAPTARIPRNCSSRATARRTSLRRSSATSRCRECWWRATRTSSAMWAGSTRAAGSGVSGRSSTCGCGARGFPPDT